MGDLIALDGFGGEVETNDGEKATLKDLVDKSGKGVVLFTYPKASTPGCASTPFNGILIVINSTHKARLKPASSATPTAL